MIITIEGDANTRDLEQAVDLLRVMWRSEIHDGLIEVQGHPSDVQDILTELHMVVDPGEYGLGSEEESITHQSLDGNEDYPEIEEYLETEKKAWERAGKLVERLMELLG
jgi:hypothetical protein